MELRVLKYFLTTARAKNISHAAEELHITQPTLSRQLKDLEEELGVQLFVRGKRETSLTTEGKFLVNRAQEMLDLAEKTRQEFRQEQNIGGSIYIGAGESPVIKDIGTVAKGLQERHPGIQFHIFTGDIETVTERIEKGLLDFGIVLGDNNLSEYNTIKLPHANTWGVLLPKDSPLAVKEQLVPQDLWDQPLLISRQSMMKNELGGWLQRPFENLNISGTYNLVRNAVYLAESGLGLVLTFEGLVHLPEDSHLTFRRIVPQHKAETFFFWKKHQVFSAASRLFLKEIMQWSEMGKD